MRIKKAATSEVQTIINGKISMRKIFYASLAAVALLLSSCSALKTSTSGNAAQSATDGTTTATTPADAQSVAPNDQLLSVAELVKVFADPANMDVAMQKYGYKVQHGYEVFRVASYDKMFYKNCRLPKKIVDGKYEDYPRALRAGISSYVAVGDGAVMLGVFNDNAYENLVAQVRAAGFQLDMEGNDDIFTNGIYYIACNKGYRTVRVTKVS